MPNPLTLLESFGDAHQRYALNNRSVIDVVREGPVWRAYEKKHGEVSSVEVAAAESEIELTLQLQGLYR